MIMRYLRLLYVSLVLVTLEVCHNVTLLSKSFSELLGNSTVTNVTFSRFFGVQTALVQKL